MDELTQAVEMLLSITRSEIADNKPQQALAALLHVIRLTRGEDAIMEVLDNAKHKATIEIDQMILTENLNEARRISLLLLEQDSILSEREEQEILKDAFEDGSSVYCVKCGDLVSRLRWDAHQQYWCAASDEMDISDI